jgi:hypothetical protein
MPYFCHPEMRKQRKTYSLYQKGSAVFMILTLLWLTISTPFVFSYQQEIAKQEKKSQDSIPVSSTEEEAGKPIGNASTTGSANTFSEEYLHDHHDTDTFFTLVALYLHSHNDDTYHAFHGELLVPPPNVA